MESIIYWNSCIKDSLMAVPISDLYRANKAVYYKLKSVFDMELFEFINQRTVMLEVFSFGVVIDFGYL